MSNVLSQRVPKNSVPLAIGLALAACGPMDSFDPAESVDPVLNGVAKGLAYPDVVALQFTSGGTCSGTLINRELVLTARHCAELVAPGDVMNLRSPNVSGGVDLVQVRAVRTNGAGFAQDLGLILLEKAVEIGNIGEFSLGYDLTLVLNESLTIVGAGLESTNDPDTTNLNVGSIEFAGEAQVTGEAGIVDAYERGPSNQIGCLGDSGGPVFAVRNGAFVLSAVFVGAQSVGCNDVTFGVGASIERNAAWLQATIAELEEIRKTVTVANGAYSETPGRTPFTVYPGNLFRYAAANSTSQANFDLSIYETGTYAVYAAWYPGPDRATNAPVTIKDGDRLVDTARVNQRLAPRVDIVRNGRAFQHIGNFPVTTGSLRIILDAVDVNGIVIADSFAIVHLNGNTSFAHLALADNNTASFVQTGPFTVLPGAGFRFGGQRSAVAGFGGRAATWTLGSISAGSYEIQANWTANVDRARNAPYDIFVNGVNVRRVLVNQRVAPVGTPYSNVVFQNIGRLNLPAGVIQVRLSNDTSDGIVIADAVRVLRL